VEAVRFMKYFGESLAERRTSAKLSRKAIADMLSVDESTVWRWETGKKWPEDPDAVVALYEREGKEGASALDLWDDAIRRAREADAGGQLERFFTPDLPTLDDLERADAERASKSARRADSGPSNGQAS
jgi:transcriptional regulator with XRE-family HTH domain